MLWMRLVKTSIYILVCPETHQCRYVGKTVEPKKRFARHLANAREEGKKIYLYSWIRGLLDKGLEPEMVIIDEVEDWIYWEAFYIEYFRAIGCKLTNLSVGGIGSTGYKHSEEHKQRMSKLFKGRKPWNTGKKYTESQKEGMRKARTGMRLSETCKSKISAANAKAHRAKSKFTQEDIDYIRTKPMSQKLLAEKYGVSQSHISRLQSGERWG